MTSCSAIGGATAFKRSVRDRSVCDLRSLPARENVQSQLAAQFVNRENRVPIWSR